MASNRLHRDFLKLILMSHVKSTRRSNRELNSISRFLCWMDEVHSYPVIPLSLPPSAILNYTTKNGGKLTFLSNVSQLIYYGVQSGTLSSTPVPPSPLLCSPTHCHLSRDKLDTARVHVAFLNGNLAWITKKYLEPQKGSSTCKWNLNVHVDKVEGT
jgi:hypothetical protein